MIGFTDLHSHFVYGIDDGAKTKEEMYAMLDCAFAQGIAAVAATPHVSPGLRFFDERLFLARLEEAREYCRKKSYPMRLIEASEIFYTPAADQAVLEHRLLTYGRSDFVLIEFSPDVRFAQMKYALELLLRCGYLPILAHAERYDCLHWAWNMREIRSMKNVRIQVNANSLLGRKGFFASRRLHAWLKNGFVDLVASDAHGPERRPFCMRRAYEALSAACGKKEAERMAASAPSVIVQKAVQMK